MRYVYITYFAILLLIGIIFYQLHNPIQKDLYYDNCGGNIEPEYKITVQQNDYIVIKGIKRNSWFIEQYTQNLSDIILLHLADVEYVNGEVWSSTWTNSLKFKQKDFTAQIQISHDKEIIRIIFYGGGCSETVYFFKL